MTQEQTLQSFEDLIKSLEENGVGVDAPLDNPFSIFGENISDMTPENFYAAFGDSDTLTAGNGVYNIVRNVDGSVRALNFTDNWGQYTQVESLESYLNSNTSIPQYNPANSFTYTQSTSFDATGTIPQIEMKGGISKFVNNVLQTQKQVTAVGLLSAAPFAAGIGLKLGKWIDGGLYNILDAIGANPPESLNPETWAQVAQYDSTGAQVFRTLFDIDTNGKMQQYVDANAATYMAYYLRTLGFFNTGETTTNIDDTTGLTIRYPLPISNASSSVKIVGTSTGNRYHENTYTVTSGAQIAVFRSINSSTEYGWEIAFASAEPFKLTTTEDGKTSTISASKAKLKGQTFYFTYTMLWTKQSDGACDSSFNIPTGSITVDALKSAGYILVFGTRTESPAIPGVVDNGQPIPDTSTWTSPASTHTYIQNNYPEWWNDRLEETVTNPDGTTKTYTYLPFALPDSLSPEGNVQTINQPATTTLVDPETETQTKLQTLIELLTNQKTTTLVDPETSTQTGTNDTNPTANDNPPDTGSGSGLPFVVPTGNASSLWAVYHPSQSQLNAFGAWLWSSDFVEQLKRLFNDPMQAVIGVHKVFAPIPTGGSSTIKCGYLDSGVSSATVSSQYTEVNCGTVDCREYFGNVFDYDPHTKVSIYLPFIGVVPLKVSEVMRSSITVTYGVDVITGACLAKVKVTRDGGGAILYSYGGSCACHYPISSGSYAGIISGIVTSAIGIAGGIVTGNPLSAIGGAMAGLHQAHTDVQRSGGFTGCSGAMGPKIPYLIIDRPQTRLAADFEAYQGKPSNSAQFIGDCSGFVRATEVHFSAPGVFDEEAREVESLLKAGVKLD